MTVREAEPGDLDAVLDLQLAFHQAVHGEARTSRELLSAHWPSAGHWVAAGPGGEVVGYAVVDPGGGFEVWVRPGREPSGAGEELIAAVRGHHPGRLETVAPAAAAELCALLDRSGIHRVHDVLEMAIELEPPPAAPRWPDGIALRAFDAGRDAADVHACLVESFAGSDERVAPFAEWLPWLEGDPMYDPALVFAAVDGGGSVAAVAQCWTEGFVKDLAVRPAHRGRGLGEALLRHAFAEYRRRGVARVALKVDAVNPTGAVRLYERVGMREIRRYAVYAG